MSSSLHIPLPLDVINGPGGQYLNSEMGHYSDMQDGTDALQ